MTTEPLAGCALSLSADDLSAWRDEAVDSAAIAHLTAHIAECAACRARLAEFDVIAQALRALPVPEPASGFGHNPRLGATTPQRRSARLRATLGSRRALGGLGTVAAVTLLLLAFTQVVGRLSVQAPPSSATTSPTSRATTAPIEPMLPALHIVTAADAWGTTGLVAHFAETRFSSAENFIPSALLPDGSAIVGQIYSGSLETNAHLALWQIPSGKVTLLNVASASQPFGQIMTDGRYIIYFESSCACSDVFVYDLQVGAVVRRIPNVQVDGPAYFDHGLYVLQSASGGINSFEVATGTHATLPDGNPATAHAQLLSFVWPYLVYIPDPSASTLPNALAVYNLTTGQRADLAALAPLLPTLLPRVRDNGNPGVAVTDSALFVVTAPTSTTNQLYELDNFMSPSPTLKPVGSVTTLYADSILVRGANLRMVGMFGSVAYDRTLGEGVRIAGRVSNTLVSGHFLMAIGPTNAHEFDPYEITIYDTNKLPGG